MWMRAAVFTLLVVPLLACPLPPPNPVPGSELIVEGRRLFFEETFSGNGRTCGTCHPAADNFTIDPDRISVTGASMGGAATWYIASHYPDRFAAAARFCGYCDYRLWTMPGSPQEIRAARLCRS